MKLSAALTLCFLGFVGLAAAQPRHWREIRTRPLIKFDFNCASQSIYRKAVPKKFVETVWERKAIYRDSVPDRAFGYDLNQDGKPEYFIPFSCGATGNCVWGLFSTRPAKFLGMIGGQYTYVHARRGRWPDLINYAHFSASEGHLSTYKFRLGHYVQVGTDYAIELRGGIFGTPLPWFLNRARAACATLGS